jgi:hypothetical protein
MAQMRIGKRDLRLGRERCHAAEDLAQLVLKRPPVQLRLEPQPLDHLVIHAAHHDLDRSLPHARTRPPSSMGIEQQPQRLATLPELQFLFRQGLPELRPDRRASLHRAEAALGLLAPIGTSRATGVLPREMITSSPRSTCAISFESCDFAVCTVTVAMSSTRR